MKIIDVTIRVFRHKTEIARDGAGHAHPGPETDATTGLLTIICDDGTEGYCLYNPEVIRSYVVEKLYKPILVGKDPFAREMIWQELLIRQRGSAEQLTDRALCAIELALWDVAGRKLGQPVHRLVGHYREKVPAYASTMVGDNVPGGLSTPEDYGRFAEQLVERGYKAIKLHTWMPAGAIAPDPVLDVKACAAVREAVGPDIKLMLDAYHWYSRTDALFLGRELQKLDYHWYEEPMDEASMTTYKWLADNLDIPVLGPEVAMGKHMVRAEWAASGACDILRTGVFDVGGLTPALKCAHVAESFNMNCEIHGGGPGNLTVTLCIKNCIWYERGLLHPFIDHDKVPQYLNSAADAMDEDGFVHAPTVAGIGWDLNLDYITDNLVG